MHLCDRCRGICKEGQDDNAIDRFTNFVMAIRRNTNRSDDMIFHIIFIYIYIYIYMYIYIYISINMYMYGYIYIYARCKIYPPAIKRGNGEFPINEGLQLEQVIYNSSIAGDDPQFNKTLSTIKTC